MVNFPSPLPEFFRVHGLVGLRESESQSVFFGTELHIPAWWRSAEPIFKSFYRDIKSFFARVATFRKDLQQFPFLL